MSDDLLELAIWFAWVLLGRKCTAEARERTPLKVKDTYDTGILSLSTGKDALDCKGHIDAAILSLLYFSSCCQLCTHTVELYNDEEAKYSSIYRVIRYAPKSVYGKLKKTCGMRLLCTNSLFQTKKRG